MVELRLLGSTELTGPDGEPIPEVLSRPKRLALLSYLALQEPGDFCRRETLVGRFWPELDESKARANLSVVLHHLRRLVGKEVVITRGVEEIGLDPDAIRVDTWEFLARIERGDLEEAAALYRGPLLGGLHVVGSGSFSQFLEERRYRLRSAALDVFSQLADRALEDGRPEGRTWLRKAYTLAPAGNRIAHRLMQCEARAGHPSLALQVYEGLAARMREDLGTEPLPETQALAAAIRSGRLEAAQLDALEVVDVSTEPPARQPPPRPVSTPATGGAPTRPAAPTAGTPPRLKIAALMVLVILAAFVWIGTGVGRSGAGADRGPVPAAAVEAVAAVPVEDIERLIVMPLENLTDDPELDVLGRLAADEMARAIDVPRPIPVVPSSTVSNMIRVLGDSATTEAVAERVLASHAYAGTVGSVGGQLSFDVELVTLNGGERLWTLGRITGPREQADSLVGALANSAALVAVSNLDPNVPPWIPRSTPPVSLRAYEAHREQSALFCQGDYRGSLESGYRAIGLSPGYPGAMSFLLVAHANLGEPAIADSLLEELKGLRDHMTLSDRLGLDFEIGLRFDPGLERRSVEEGYRIDPASWGTVAAMTAVGERRMSDAIERYRMGARYVDACPWPPHWRFGALAFHTLERFADEMAVARDGLARHPDHPVMRDIQARVHAALGQVAQIDSLLDVMENLPRQPGRWDPNLRGMYAALELIAHGYPESGERIMKETVADLSDSSARNRARGAYWAGRFEEAVPRFEDLLEAEPERVEYLWHYGASLARVGEEEEAREVIDRLGALDTRNGGHTWGQGLITAVLGDRDDAVRLFQEAFDQGRRFTIEVHREPALRNMWGYGPFDALMAPR